MTISFLNLLGYVILGWFYLALSFSHEHNVWSAIKNVSVFGWLVFIVGNLLAAVR